MPVIVSKANKSLIVPINPETGSSMWGHWGDLPRLDAGHFILPHGMRETLILRHMGFKVPNPMELYYDFPHPPEEPPFKVQKVTCNLLIGKSTRIRS